MVGRKDLIGGASSLGSHSAHVSLPHLLPRLPFFTFLCSALFQPCPSSFLISPHCPQQLGRILDRHKHPALCPLAKGLWQLPALGMAMQQGVGRQGLGVILLRKDSLQLS